MTIYKLQVTNDKSRDKGQTTRDKNSMTSDKLQMTIKARVKMNFMGWGMVVLVFLIGVWGYAGDFNWCDGAGKVVVDCTDPIAEPVISGDISLCEGEALQLTSSIVDGATSYHWSGPNGLEESGTVLSIDIISPSFSGVYDLMVVRAGGTICDTSYASVNVIVHPTSFVINEHQMCPGDVYEYNDKLQVTSDK
jgi:hypothetical protein